MPCSQGLRPHEQGILFGGEQGIRTLETALTVYTISSRAPSTSSDNSPRRLSIIHYCGGKIKCFLRFFSFSFSARFFGAKKQPPLLRQPFVRDLFVCVRSKDRGELCHENVELDCENQKIHKCSDRGNHVLDSLLYFFLSSWIFSNVKSIANEFQLAVNNL